MLDKNTFQAPGSTASLHSGPDKSVLLDTSGNQFPVVNGIPVLLSDTEQVEQLVKTDWENSSEGGDTVNFYNRIQDHDSYCRDQLNETKEDFAAHLSRIAVSGPVLDVGSGKGPLQGVAEDYCALDLSLTALERHISPRYVRVCASAEEIPFPDEHFRSIVSVAALEHVPRADMAFDEIDRTLKTGGLLYLLPAWHCEQYNCDGIPVRPYNDLTWRQKVTKLFLPVLRSPVFKACHAVPWRVYRRLQALFSSRPGKLSFKRLKPDYEQFWISDSDAASRIDIHEACLFFAARGYEILSPGKSSLKQVFARHVPLIAVKKSSSEQSVALEGSGSQNSVSNAA